MWPNNPPRIKAFPYRGCRRYLITMTTCFRARYFSITEHARTPSAEIPPFFAARHFEVLAYCVMPDHLHLLLKGRQTTPTYAKLCALGNSGRVTTGSGALGRVCGNRDFMIA
jgi:REP element-mobilizing transposase RayT